MQFIQDVNQQLYEHITLLKCGETRNAPEEVIPNQRRGGVILPPPLPLFILLIF